MTSAPKSASNIVHVGPANTRVRSRTLISANGGGMPVVATDNGLVQEITFPPAHGTAARRNEKATEFLAINVSISDDFLVAA